MKTPLDDDEAGAPALTIACLNRLHADIPA